MGESFESVEATPWMEYAQASYSVAVRQAKAYFGSVGREEYLEFAVRPAILEFVFFWAAALLFMSWDVRLRDAGELSLKKLATRHGLSPFWRSQLRCVPLVLFNQSVICISVRALFTPLWATRHIHVSEASWPFLIFGFIAAALFADFWHYFNHRLSHTKPLWRLVHEMHHRAPQTGITGSYNHPLEHILFVAEGILPMAVLGYPILIHNCFVAISQVSSAGDHSGYSGGIADGDHHNAHHYKRNVNFSFMVSDWVFGTYFNAKTKQLWNRERVLRDKADVDEFDEGSGGEN